MNSDWYRELFEAIRVIYGSDIYAYYYDLSFEETFRRHKTKPNCDEFGETEMKSWWKEKDYIGIIPEKVLSSEMREDEVVDMIVKRLQNNQAYFMEK